MPILNDCYPETLKAFYVLGANWFYRAMWSVVKIFVSKRTEDKIHLLPEVEGTMSLIQIFRNSYQSPVWPRNTGDL